MAALVRKEQYFVVHAPRQYGKTTAFLSFANETNARGDAVAMYCSLETVQGFPKADDGVPMVYALVRYAASQFLSAETCPALLPEPRQIDIDVMKTSGIQRLISEIARVLAKPFYVFFDEVDRLGVSEGWLVVADTDLTKPWDEKISSEDIPADGKTIHRIRY